MLSRVAESIFWMARYMERTNRTLRMLHTKYLSSQDEVTNFSWLSVLQTYSDKPEKEYSEMATDSQWVLQHLLLDKDNSYSVINSITYARENARSVQDHITKEVWQCLNEYYHLIREAHIQYNVQYGDPVTALDALIRHGMLYSGTVDITMARDEGFNYLNVGKFLSRAIVTIDLLMIKLKEYNFEMEMNRENPTWRFLLYSLSGYELYLKRNRGHLDGARVIDHVLYNADFPHSLVYSLKHLGRYFERLKNESKAENYSQLEFMIGRCVNNVRYSQVSDQSTDLVNFLMDTKAGLYQIADLFNKNYFGNT